MHLPFIAHTCASQMYVTITCMRLKCALCFISWLYRQDHGAVEVYFEGWTTWAKMVFSKRYTFPCYRASQSRGSTRRLSFTTCVKSSIKHIVISIYLNSMCYLFSYTRLFTKLNLFGQVSCGLHREWYLHSNITYGRYMQYVLVESTTIEVIT